MSKKIERELDRTKPNREVEDYPVDSFCVQRVGKQRVRIYDDHESIYLCAKIALSALSALPDNTEWEQVWETLSESED